MNTPHPTAPRLRIETLTVTAWWCLRTSHNLWRKHTAPPSRFTLPPHQLEQSVFIFGGTRRAPDLGGRR
jgi:hypothetical protein